MNIEHLLTILYNISIYQIVYIAIHIKWYCKEVKVEEVIRKLFVLDPKIQILDDYGPREFNGWDSLGHLSLMTELELVYNISI